MQILAWDQSLFIGRKFDIFHQVKQHGINVGTFTEKDT